MWKGKGEKIERKKESNEKYKDREKNERIKVMKIEGKNQKDAKLWKKKD